MNETTIETIILGADCIEESLINLVTKARIAGDTESLDALASIEKWCEMIRQATDKR